MDGMRLGSAEVVRVVEWLGPLAPVDQLFPDTPASAWDEAGWLAPSFYDPAERLYRAAVQTWIVRTGGAVVLVDTGIGNDRDRPQIPRFANLQTDYLERLAAVGVAPQDVDVVVNTHIHYDHVGWNTRREGGEWVPTFPNARYVLPAADLDYFHPDNAAAVRAPRTEDEARRFAGIRLVYADSVAPVVAAGQVTGWRDHLDLPGGLSLHPAPGHTPGSSVLHLDAGPGAVFVGDLLHVPLQVVRPQDSCAFDLDPEQARRSRRSVLQRAARSGELVLPAHFAGPGGATVRSVDGAGGEVSIERWAPLAPA